MNGIKKIIIICIVVFLGGFILNKLFNKINTFKTIEGMDEVGETIGKNLGEGEGHCTKDDDCGPGLKCFGTANTNPPGVKGVTTHNHATYGGGRHCYNPETKDFLKFKKDFIEFLNKEKNS